MISQESLLNERIFQKRGIEGGRDTNRVVSNRFHHPRIVDGIENKRLELGKLCRIDVADEL